MKKITVKKLDGTLIHESPFEQDGYDEAWLDQNKATNAWGKPDRWLPDFLEGAETRQNVFDEETSTTEYLHPAEYTIEIVEESLDIIKARKIAELRALCLSSNDELIKWHSYINANITAGVYEAEGTPEKAELYRASFINKTLVLKTELRRCEALVNVATSEEEVNNVTFNVA